MSEQPGDVGATVDHYHMDGVLGRGGFATVYKAYDPRFDQHVAMKILHGRFAHDPDQRRQFVQEARLLRSLEHPNLVDVVDVGETLSGLPYLVMTYADRGSLHDRLAGAGETPTPQAEMQVQRLISAVASAIGHLHQRKLVHRDIKPANVLFRSNDVDEQILIGDFGMVKDLQQGGVTRGGGSLAYAAPEQRATVAVVDERTDVFAASATVAEAALGRTRHTHESWGEFLDEVGSSRPDLAIALRIGMSELPAERFQTIQQWAEMSDSALVGRALRTSPVEQRRGIRRRYGLMAAVGVAAVGVVLTANASRDRSLLTSSAGEAVVDGQNAADGISSQCVEQAGSVPAPEVLQVTDNAIVLGWQPTEEVRNIFVDGSYLDSTKPGSDSRVVERAPKRADRLSSDTEYEIAMALPEDERTTICVRTAGEAGGSDVLVGVYGPTGLQMATVTATTIEVEWDLRPGADFHNLFLDGRYVKADGQSKESTVVGDSTTYTFTNLEPGTEYEIGIRRLQQKNVSELVTIAATTLSP